MDTLRLLLVDPNPDQAQLDISATADSIVLPASNFSEASEAISVQRFDAVLLRQPLSPEDVRTFTASLRNLEKAQKNPTKTPVLLLSSDVTPDSGWIRGSEETPGIDGILPAQFQHETLLAAVDGLTLPLSQSATQQSLSSEIPVFEREKFTAQMGGDPDLIVEIIDLFFVECDRQVSRVKQAFAERAYDETAKLAHSLKGSFSSLHTPQARSAANDLEMAAKQRDAAGCEHAVADLEKSIASIVPLLYELRNKCGVHL